MTRLFAIVGFAVLINLLIFSVIEIMVGGKRVRLTEADSVEIANFVRLNEASRAVRSRRDPTAPQKPAADLRKDLQRLESAAGASDFGALALNAPALDIELGPTVAGNIQIARELTPLVRVPPDYPPGALSKRVEGFVLLRFVVSETGSVEDPEILRAEPEGLFEHAARRAVLRWKYQPQIRDGRPARVVTMTRLVFKLDLPERDDA
ncbi:MAG: energy transducer TonB [Pseudomonadota bacterium]